MIVAMQKYSFLVYHKDYSDFLDKIRDLGVVDVVVRQKEVSDAVRNKYDLIRQFDAAIKFLEARQIEAQTQQLQLKGEEVLEKINTLHSELENRNQQLASLRKEIQAVAPWGHFSVDVLKKLKEQHLSVRFYTTASRRFDPLWVEQYPIEVIAQEAGLVYFVLIQQEGSEEIKLDAEEMRAPEKPFDVLREYEDKVLADVERIQKEYDHLAATTLDILKTSRLQLIERADYQKVVENTLSEADDKVKMLEGWAPKEKQEELADLLDKAGVVYVITEASLEDKVPVELKNNRFARLFEPIGDFYELPNHRELDLVPFFAPFYMMFFGFCLGDAGYGLFIILMAGLFKRKLPAYKSILTLAQLLGLSTVIFGMLTGTFFGISLIKEEIPFLEGVKQFMINEEQLFNLAIILGVVQILFGMVIKVFNVSRMLGFRHAMSTIGWLILLIGGGTLFGLESAGIVSASLYKVLMYVVLAVSGILILVLNHPKRNVLVNVGAGLWDVYGVVTGLLGDLLSYLRLFALGVSSAILGMVFNSMAMNIKPDHVIFGPLVMVLILVFGHGITLFMSALGAFVHPIRLTFVEFYKNAGFTGGGKKYQPFKKLT